MRGVSSQAKLNISAQEDNLQRVIQAVNRLPLGFVGFAATRITNFTLTNTATWEEVPMTTVLEDSDALLAADGLSATIPAGCEGYWVLRFHVATNIDVGAFRMLVNDVPLIQASVPARVDIYSNQACVVSHPKRLNVGDVVTWEYKADSTTYTLDAQDTAVSESIPSVSGHRVGLIP